MASIGKTKYVAFGHSDVIGDLIEVIDANQGILTKIVQNVPEVCRPNRPTLADRLARLQDPQRNPNRVNDATPVVVQLLEDFIPQPDERYIIGFTGFKMATLVAELAERFAIECAPLVHPTATISATVQLSPGTIVQAGAIVGDRVRLGSHVFVNKGVCIDSATTVNRFSSLAPGVVVGRNVSIGFGVTLGIGARVLDSIEVADYATVAAGACVTDTVARNSLVVGVPAVLKRSQFHPSVAS